MIQMCVYNSILAGRLGDCWLAPGRLLAGPWEGWLAPGKAATADCAGRLLAGPWKGWLRWELLAGPWGGWLVCVQSLQFVVLLIFAEFANFHWLPSLGDDADYSGYGVDMFRGESQFGCNSNFEWSPWHVFSTF